MRYNTVLFDADDTLMDFKRSEHDAIYNVLSDMELPNDDGTISVYSEINDSLWKLLELGGITKEELKIERFRRLCEHYGFSASPENMAQKYINALAEQSHLIDGAVDLCKSLSEAGASLYLVTNGIKYIQTKRFSATELPPYFKKVFISEEIGFEKPRIEFFNSVASQIPGFDRQRTLIVGDSLSSDIKGGNNAGISTCWYNPKYKPRPDGIPITYEIHDLADVVNILEI